MGEHPIRTLIEISATAVEVLAVAVTMACVRTGTSLISFGFRIHKFFHYQVERGQATATVRLIFLAVLFYVVRLVLRLFRLFFDAVGSGSVTLKGFDRDWAAPTYKITYRRAFKVS